jgi:hypothetical protein
MNGTEINLPQTAAVQRPLIEPPPCYGTGKKHVTDPRWPCSHYVRVSPRECFHCEHETRCLAQQRRLK